MLQQENIGLSLARQETDIIVTVSAVASNLAQMTQARIVLPLLFWLPPGRWGRLEEVKKPSDTAASD